MREVRMVCFISGGKITKYYPPMQIIITKNAQTNHHCASNYNTKTVYLTVIYVYNCIIYRDFLYLCICYEIITAIRYICAVGFYQYCNKCTGKKL